MSNTVIQIKHSVNTGESPVSLVNGEIAINTFDGKLFYSDPEGTIQSIQNFPGPAGLDTEIQFNDSGSLGANAGLTFDKTTGNLSATYIHTGSFVEFSDGTKQYTANAGGAGGGGPTVTVDTSPPASGNVSGDLWIDSNTGVTFTWLDDSDSFQWVELGPTPTDGLTIYSGDLTVSGNILPSLNVTYDLGSPTERWRDAYFSGSSIYLGNVIIKSTENEIQFFRSDGTTRAPITNTPSNADATALAAALAIALGG